MLVAGFLWTSQVIWRAIPGAIMVFYHYLNRRRIVTLSPFDTAITILSLTNFVIFLEPAENDKFCQSSKVLIRKIEILR